VKEYCPTVESSCTKIFLEESREDIVHAVSGSPPGMSGRDHRTDKGN
jgi:hypothetical protein